MKKLRLAKGAEEVAARAWLVEPCSHEVTKSLERLARAADVQRIAVMPDVHLSKEVFGRGARHDNAHLSGGRWSGYRLRDAGAAV